MRKAVLVTGASGGIGQAIVQRLLSDGYRVFAQAHTHAEALRDSAAEAVVADLADFSQAAAMTERVIARARADGDVFCGLVNNAGVACFQLCQDMTEEDFCRVMRTNFQSAFACTKAAVPTLVHQKDGFIVNISSMWGERGAAFESIYSASKGALNAFSRALGKELAPSNVRVNAIACGVIDTPMNAHLSEEERRALCDAIPMGRYGQPAEVAALVGFLAQGECAYLTGQVLTVDGAFS